MSMAPDDERFEMMDAIKSAAGFDVSDEDFYGSGYAGRRHAPMMIEGR
jgi:hypothetical protein